ncbi:MAG: GIY-YIG nuclease family protein [Candidatus Marinimicrobia bacterium]|nr:GIY-YIG nuclease family protein [Candidatus Neomarinimicrobiota bacterium]
MSAQKYNIIFKGYWREVKKGGIPSESGIYCVYTCTHDKKGGTVTLKKLVYIGESKNVHKRIEDHEKLAKWRTHLKQDEILCYNFGSVSSTSRDRCEAAMIFKHKPPENTEYVNSFPFDQTSLSLSGKTTLLTTKFTVKKK